MVAWWHCGVPVVWFCGNVAMVVWGCGDVVMWCCGVVACRFGVVCVMGCGVGLGLGLGI